MEVERLRTFLRHHRTIAFDTSVFIYQLEMNPKYLPVSDHIFSWIERKGSQAVTSTITMTELLVQPYRNQDEQLVDRLYGLLSTYPNLEWVPPSLEIADLAAQMRAHHRLRTPDALQAATAVQCRATAFITNDPVFSKVEAFQTLIVDEFV